MFYCEADEICRAGNEDRPKGGTPVETGSPKLDDQADWCRRKDVSTAP